MEEPQKNLAGIISHKINIEWSYDQIIKLYANAGVPQEDKEWYQKTKNKVVY